MSTVVAVSSLGTSRGGGIRWTRAIAAGIAGAVVSLIVIGVLYRVSAPFLFDPALQSKKVLDVYSTIRPLPLQSTNIAVFALGWVIVGSVRGIVFAWLYEGIPGRGVQKGLTWGISIWLTIIMFAEFYTAINLLGEPLYLSIAEFVLQLPAYLGEGAVVATIYRGAQR